MDNTIIIFLAGCTLITAILTLLAYVTDIFKKAVPLNYGFLINDSVLNKIYLSTGDSAKEINIRFHNTSKTTLTGIEIDIRFLRPLALSGTNKALTLINNQTIHGSIPDKSYYWIHYSNLIIVGNDILDIRIELNTQGISVGTHKVLIEIHSTQQNYKYKKSTLYINTN